MGFFVESKMLRLLSLMILIMDLIFFHFSGPGENMKWKKRQLTPKWNEHLSRSIVGVKRKVTDSQK